MGKLRASNYSGWSLFFGLLSILIPTIGIILGILGIAFSRMANNDIKQNRLDGRGTATAGMICSVLGLIIQILLIVLGAAMFYKGTTF